MTQRAPASFASAVLTTGLIAGLLDGTAASVQYFLRTSQSPTRVFSYIAGALFAAGTIDNSLAVALGVCMHLAIAMTWTLLFFLAASRLRLLRSNPWLVGPAYGLVVWVLMNRVLVPLTRIGPPKSFNPTQAAIGAAILVVCIGIPIALGAQRSELWHDS